MSMHALLRIAVLLVVGCMAAVAWPAGDPKVLELEAAAQYAIPAPPVPVSGMAPPVIQDSTIANADLLTHEFRLQRESNKLMEAGFVSLLAIVLLFLVLRFLSSRGPAATPHMVSATGLICIVFGTILLVLMAETESQLTASVGILGAVAGYLFRSMHQDAEADSKADSKARPKTLTGTPGSPDDADGDRN